METKDDSDLRLSYVHLAKQPAQDKSVTLIVSFTMVVPLIGTVKAHLAKVRRGQAFLIRPEDGL